MRRGFEESDGKSGIEVRGVIEGIEIGRHEICISLLNLVLH
jgi:hypothetical protein